MASDAWEIRGAYRALDRVVVCDAQTDSTFSDAVAQLMRRYGVDEVHFVLQKTADGELDANDE